jgi:hypothetical protein
MSYILDVKTRQLFSSFQMLDRDSESEENRNIEAAFGTSGLLAY